MINRIIILLLVLTSTFSCKEDKRKVQDDQDTAKSVQDASVNNESNYDFFYKTIVSNLRLRPYPSTQGKVLTTLSKDHKLIVVHKTPFKQEISIGGKMRNEPWYKVFYNTDSLLTGWVYGGGIQIDSSITQNITFFEDLTVLEADGLLQIEGFDEEYATFNGFYGLKTDTQGNPLLDGLWFAKGQQLGNEGDELFSRVFYAGHYKNGKKEGLFVENYEFYEGAKRTEISFKDGSCSSNTTTFDKEGTSETIQRPVLNCTF